MPVEYFVVDWGCAKRCGGVVQTNCSVRFRLKLSVL